MILEKEYMKHGLLPYLKCVSNIGNALIVTFVGPILKHLSIIS